MEEDHEKAQRNVLVIAIGNTVTTSANSLWIIADNIIQVFAGNIPVFQ